MGKSQKSLEYLLEFLSNSRSFDFRIFNIRTFKYRGVKVEISWTSIVDTAFFIELYKYRGGS